MPLRILLPILLILILVFDAILTYLNTAQDIRNNLYVMNTSIIKTKSALLQNSIEKLYQHDDIDSIKQLLTSVGHDPHIKLAVFVDHENVVIGSIQLNHIGKPFHDIESLITSIPPRLHELLHGKNPNSKLSVVSDDNDNLLTSIYPVTLGSSKDSLRTDLVGALVLQKDLTDLYKQSGAKLLGKTAYFTILNLFLICLIAILLHFVFSRRLQDITNTTQEIANGNLSARLQNTKYNDELGVLGQSVNTMAHSLEEDQKDLRDSESRFHTLARLAPVGIFQTDENGRCTYVNDTWLKITGMTFDEALGFGWAEALHPDDKQAVFETWNTSAQENTPFDMEYRFIRPDGVSSWVYGQAEAQYDERDEIISYICTITNIEDRRKSELKHFQAQRRMRKQQRASLLFAQKQKNASDNLHEVYRQLCETVASHLEIERVSIWLFNATTDSLVCEELYISSSKQHKTNMTLSVNDYPTYFNAISSNQIISVDDTYTHPDTSELTDTYLKSNGISSMLDAPIRSGKGNVIGVLCLEHIDEPRHWYSDEENFASSLADMLSLSIELHTRKQVENKLTIYRDQLEDKVEQRTRELESSNNELESFTYSVSHDLRTPLRGIDGFSKILLEKYDDQLDQQGQEYLKRVRAAAQRMEQLINDLLQLSHINKETIQLQKINLSTLTEKSIQELQQAEPERNVNIIIEADLNVDGDSKLMQIIMDNLIGNAWKFTAKSKNPCIEFGRLPDSDETIYFVRDNGSGFDMHYVEKLFQVFQRLHRTDEFPGTGIGLSTVSRLIQRLGGRIWAESEVDKGATFFFTLNSIK